MSEFDFKITSKKKRYHCRPMTIHDLKPILDNLKYSYGNSDESKKYEFDWNDHLLNAYNCFNASYDSEILSIDGISNGTMWLKTIANNIHKLSTKDKSKCYYDIKKFINKYGIE
jgi:hypothetical protein